MRIISGGQTGVDRRALELAKQHGFETGGTAPKGFRTTDGVAPELATEFGLVESDLLNYRARTNANARDGNITLIYVLSPKSGGTKCTINAAAGNHRPFLLLDMNKLQPDDATLLAMELINEVNPRVINIAGNSEKTSPGISEKVTSYLEALFAAIKTM